MFLGWSLIGNPIVQQHGLFSDNSPLACDWRICHFVSAHHVRLDCFGASQPTTTAQNALDIAQPPETLAFDALFKKLKQMDIHQQNRRAGHERFPQEPTAECSSSRNVLRDKQQWRSTGFDLISTAVFPAADERPVGVSSRVSRLSSANMSQRSPSRRSQYPLLLMSDKTLGGFESVT